MRALEPDSTGLAKELWDDHQQKLTRINERALDSIQQHRGLFLEIPLDDADTFKAICRGEVELILFSSEIAHWLLQQLQPKCFQELLITLAFNRPNSFYFHLSAFHTLVHRKNGQAPIIYPDPAAEPLLAETFGFPIFSEQAGKLVSTFTDFSLPEACELLQKLKNRFYNLLALSDQFLYAALRKGYEGEVAWQVFALLAEFTPEATSRKVAESYLLPAYQAAYLQIHYPTEYREAQTQCGNGKA